MEKSVQELRPFSSEHHHGLLLSWKIRTGISKGVSFDRIKKYSDWFYKSFLKPHFEAECDFVFPILGEDHPLVKKALSQQRRIEKLFLGNKDPEIALSLGEEKLEQHIRFEERKLFPCIREVATPEQLQRIDEFYSEQVFEENTEDEFWV